MEILLYIIIGGALVIMAFAVCLLVLSLLLYTIGIPLAIALRLLDAAPDALQMLRGKAAPTRT